jgi:hypothetical protein
MVLADLWSLVVGHESLVTGHLLKPMVGDGCDLAGNG